jgi:hypothetical protein
MTSNNQDKAQETFRQNRYLFIFFGVLLFAGLMANIIDDWGMIKSAYYLRHEQSAQISATVINASHPARGTHKYDIQYRFTLNNIPYSGEDRGDFVASGNSYLVKYAKTSPDLNQSAVNPYYVPERLITLFVAFAASVVVLAILVLGLRRMKIAQWLIIGVVLAFLIELLGLGFLSYY